MDDYRIAFIYGVTDDECNIKDGELEFYGDANDSELSHSQCLKDHAEEHFPNVKVFNMLNFRHRPEVISYFYTVLGHIVFLNITKNVKKYGKSGLFLLPNEITEKQRVTLKRFCENISDYSISIMSDLKIEDGILDGRELSSVEKQNPAAVFDLYFGREERHVKQV